MPLGSVVVKLPATIAFEVASKISTVIPESVADVAAFVTVPVIVPFGADGLPPLSSGPLGAGGAGFNAPVVELDVLLEDVALEETFEGALLPGSAVASAVTTTVAVAVLLLASGSRVAEPMPTVLTS